MQKPILEQTKKDRRQKEVSHSSNAAATARYTNMKQQTYLLMAAALLLSVVAIGCAQQTRREVLDHAHALYGTACPLAKVRITTDLTSPDAQWCSHNLDNNGINQQYGYQLESYCKGQGYSGYYGRIVCGTSQIIPGYNGAPPYTTHPATITCGTC
jgi:hypothetical protein